MKHTTSTLIITTILAASNLSAATFVFDLRDTGFESSIEAGAYTINGVTMSMAAAAATTDPATPNPTLNQSGGGFGINHLGGSADEADQIDGDEGDETITFSFDVPGTLDQLDMSSYALGDTFDLKKNDITILSLVNQGIADIFFPAESFTATDTFSLSYTGGNGASFDAVTITTVPEPSSALLLSLAGSAFLFRRKK